MIIFKNIFSFGLTLKAFEWLVQMNTKATPLFNILASVQLVVCLLSIPMCTFHRLPLVHWQHRDNKLTFPRHLWQADSQLFPSTRHP